MSFHGDKRSILVTGGAGYIGAHCASYLHKAGFNPVSFDNLSTGHQSSCDGGRSSSATLETLLD